MENSILRNVLFQSAVYVSFLVIFVRVIFKDILLTLLDNDYIYVEFCRCQNGIDSFFIKQALVFDIFDFILASVITLYIFKVAF
jgi:hypothetical protein